MWSLCFLLQCLALGYLCKGSGLESFFENVAEGLGKEEEGMNKRMQLLELY